VGVILVVGATKANREIPSWLMAIGRELEPEWVDGVHTVGMTPGAPPPPEVLVEDVIDALRRLGQVEVTALPGREEMIEFRLPPQFTTAWRTLAHLSRHAMMRPRPPYSDTTDESRKKPDGNSVSPRAAYRRLPAQAEAGGT
jgi:hypothetical protein